MLIHRSGKRRATIRREGVVEGVRVRVGPHCSGVRPKGCPHKFHHVAEQNAIGSARIVCLYFDILACKTLSKSRENLGQTYGKLTT